MTKINAAGAANTQPVQVESNTNVESVGCLCGMKFSDFSLSRIVPGPIKRAADFFVRNFDAMKVALIGRPKTDEKEVVKADEKEVVTLDWPTSDHVQFERHEGYRLKNFDSLPEEMAEFHLGSCGGKMLCHFEYDSPHAFEMCKDAELLRKLIEFQKAGGEFKANYIQPELVKVEDNVLYFNPIYCGEFNEPKTDLRDAMRDVLRLPPFQTAVVERPVAPTLVVHPANRYLRDDTVELSDEKANAGRKTETAVPPNTELLVSSVLSGVTSDSTNARTPIASAHKDVEERVDFEKSTTSKIAATSKASVETIEDTIREDNDPLAIAGEDKEPPFDVKHAVSSATVPESDTVPELGTGIEAAARAATDPVVAAPTTAPVKYSVAPGRGIGKEAFDELQRFWSNGGKPDQKV